jgi:predicted small lipoprotein YifL
MILRFGWLLLVISCLGLVAGCGNEGPQETPKQKAAREATEGPDLKGGTKHDPPVEKTAVKDGQWYCDMGTVHYSRHDEGDGRCPLCGMDLVEKK